MSDRTTRALIEADQRFLWHPLANHCEGSIVDIAVFGKALTEGYVTLAIMIGTEELFGPFDGSVAEEKALAYGHSYTGNALGCAAAMASFEIFARDHVLEHSIHEVCRSGTG